MNINNNPLTCQNMQLLMTTRAFSQEKVHVISYVSISSYPLAGILAQIEAFV